MRKKHLNGLLLLLLITAFLSAGCAYKSAAALQAAPPNQQLSQEREVHAANSEPASADSGMEDLDDDFFEDEFEEEQAQIADPLSMWNRAMFHFNDKLYFWVLKPLARGYKAVTPDFFRTGVKNFFRNLTTPIRLVNCALQGKGEAFGIEFARFVMNTTVGVLGLGNPADNYPRLIRPDEEDLGQTLGKYGIGNGFYIVWPVIGPSTLRDTVGRVGDWFLNPVSYIDPQEASWGVWSFDQVNQTSFRIGDYEALKKAAIDPYIALRDVYIQFRTKKVLK
ncbi:MAG: VacJ family lipoprotein [Candidatus Desulfatibia sp.]|uniref:MlaA family lipoprotein n=1 Tax=Candidatus Desulfatibia sp. TaxID=3101189 RepID=UPI002F2F6F5F